MASSGSSTFTGLTFGSGTLSNANNADNGAALYVADGTLTLTDCTITNNTATTNGGAIYIASGIVNIDDGNTLANNTAQNGGAIYLAEKDSAVLNFTGSQGIVLRGNTAEQNGGAVCAERYSVMTSEATVTFQSNTAKNGGALWIRAGSQLNDMNSPLVFDTNTADYGGALYVAIEAQSQLTLNSSKNYTFINNYANYDGGAIYTVKADVIIDGIEISGNGNTAKYGGGFLCSGGNTTVNASTISGQTAQYGGAIYSQGTVTITDSIFEDNKAEVESGAAIGGGGAIFVDGEITIESSDFLRNNSITVNVNQGGGALFISGDAVINNSSFSSNVHSNSTTNSTNGGGAIYVKGSLTVNAASFTMNNAAGNGASRGGAIYADVSTVDIIDSLFRNNRAVNNGGAVTLAGRCIATITSTNFENNTSTQAYGGAIYAQGTLTITSNYFYLNRSTRDGGAIYFDQHNNASAPGSISVETSLFTQNSSGVAPSQIGRGGALFLIPDVATINRCAFDSNQSSTSNGESRGGAVYIDTSDSASAQVTTIKNSMFSNNQVYGGATNYGGALYTKGEVTLISSNFTNQNSAVDRGGALFVDTGTLTITACIIAGNVADIGRDVYAEGTITSRGYNRIGVYGKGGTDTSWLADITTSTTDRENSAWNTTTFFGDNAEMTNTDGTHNAPQIGSSLGDAVYLLAIPLNEIESLPEIDRASNIIPFDRRFTLNIEQYDIWSTNRFADNNAITIGCIYFGGSGGGGGEDDKYLYVIQSVTMSGIPNTLKSIGQTSSLIALITYTNGRTAYGVPYDATTTRNQTERVTWSSSLPNFVRIDKNGNITALQATSNANGAIITVTTERSTAAGIKATASRAVKVLSIPASYMNTVSQAYQNQFVDYINSLAEHDVSVSFVDPDTYTVGTSGFQRNFKSAFGINSANVVTDLSSSQPMFTTATNYSNSQGLAASNGAAVSINFSNRNDGDLFPLSYSWNLTGNQVKALLGYDMTGKTLTNSEIENIFDKLHIIYQTPTRNMEVIGENVSASDAVKYNALVVEKSDGDAGLRIELTGYLANIASSNSAALVKGSGTTRLLIIPDGANDSAITGTMWLAQNASTVVNRDSNSGSNNQNNNNQNNNNNNNSGDSGSGGGGGCDTLGLGLLFSLASITLFIKKHR